MNNNIDNLIKNYKNINNNLMVEIEKQNNNTWNIDIDIDKNKNTIKITNKYLTYLQTNFTGVKNVECSTYLLTLDKRYIIKNEIISVINNVGLNKIIDSDYIYYINISRERQDDLKIKSINKNEFKFIWNTGSKGTGRTFVHPISKTNLLDILNKIILEM